MIIGGAIGTVLLVVIIALVSFVLLARFTKFGGDLARKIPFIGQYLAPKESFISLRDPTFKETYDNAMITLTDDALNMVGRYTILPPEDEVEIKVRILARMKKLYDDNKGDQAAITAVIGKALTDALKEETNETHPELLDYFDKVITDKAQTYLSYLDNRFSYLDTMGIDKSAQSKLINIGEPLQHRFKKGKVRPGNIYKENVLNDEVNREHGGRIKRKLLGYNANNLIVGIKRHGFSAGLKRQTSIDPRGRPRALIRKLASLNSAKDPNSLIRSGNWNVHDVLVSAKGLSNEQMYKKEFDRFATRIGDPEYNTFKYISNRIIDPDTTMERRINKNIMEGIKSEIRSNRPNLY